MLYSTETSTLFSVLTYREVMRAVKNTTGIIWKYGVSDTYYLEKTTYDKQTIKIAKRTKEGGLSLCKNNTKGMKVNTERKIGTVTTRF